MKRVLLLLAVLFLPCIAQAQAPASCVVGTNLYYIDIVAGLDSNTQTQAKSKTTPWAHQPYMPTFTGSYVHSAGGDCYIFKGGVTWPNANFPIIPPRGGISSAPDYYGTDPTWFSGTNSGNVNVSGTQVTLINGSAFQAHNTSWNFSTITIGGTPFTVSSVQSPTLLTLTASGGVVSSAAYTDPATTRPIFNSGGVVVSGNNIEFDLGAHAVSWVIIDGIKWKGHFWNGVTSFGTNVTINANVGSASGLIIENNEVSGWNHAPYSGPNPNTQDGWAWLFGNDNSICTGCIAKGNYGNGDAADGGDPQSGIGIMNFEQITNNIMLNMPDQFTGTAHIVNGNIACFTNDAFDQVLGNSGGQHGDTYFLVLVPQENTQYFYDNIACNTSEGSEGPYFFEAGAQHTDGSSVTLWAFNNLAYFGNWGPPFVLDNRCFGSGCNSAVWNYHLWNNTAVQNATGCPPSVFCTGPSVPGQSTATIACIRVGAGGGSTGLGIVDLENNHCGTNYSPGSSNTSCMGATVSGRTFDCGTNGNQTGGSFPVVTPTDLDNTLTGLTALTADGYTVANLFQPTSITNPTVSGPPGVNLTSLATGPLAPLANALNAFPPSVTGPARPASASGACPGSVGCWQTGAYNFPLTGTASFSPNTLAFGTVTQGTSSSGQPSTLTNTNPGTITYTSLTISGTNASDFTQTSTCGSFTGGTLASGANCVVTVVFHPTATVGTPETATLTVTFTGGAGSPTSIALGGTSGANSAPAATTFPVKLMVLPLPVAPTMTATSSSPTSSYVTSSGVSQDGKTYTSSIAVQLIGTNFPLSGAACTFEGTTVPCTCGSLTECIATVPASMIPIPSSPTSHTINFILPNPTVIIPPVQ